MLKAGEKRSLFFTHCAHTQEGLVVLMRQGGGEGGDLWEGEHGPEYASLLDREDRTIAPEKGDSIRNAESGAPGTPRLSCWNRV